MRTTRIIKSVIENDILIIKIPEFGYEFHYKMHPITTIDTETRFEDNLPDIAASVTLEFIKSVTTKDSKTHDEVIELLKDKSIIPEELIYDHILLGFVYSDNSDPNNHRWWLDFRNANNQNIYNYFTDKLEINCPITTKTWHDANPDGIWHGRFVFFPTDLKSILEPKPGKLIIKGKLKEECKPIKSEKVCTLENIPGNSESLRLRYNIREDIWFCDILDKQEKQISQIPCKSIVCDAKMYGEVVLVGGKPKVSTRINVNDISEIAIAINSLIIRGK